MNEYPYAITKQCSKCGQTFICKGEGWNHRGKAKTCPFEFAICYCEKCNPFPPKGGRSRGCEEITLREEVQFT